MARPGEASFPPGQTWGFSAVPMVAGEGGLPHLWREAAGRGKGRAVSPFCLAPPVPLTRRLRAFFLGPVTWGGGRGERDAAWRPGVRGAEAPAHCSLAPPSPGVPGLALSQCCIRVLGARTRSPGPSPFPGAFPPLALLELVGVCVFFFFVARPSAEDCLSGGGLALLPGSLGKGRGRYLPASVAARREQGRPELARVSARLGGMTNGLPDPASRFSHFGI